MVQLDRGFVLCLSLFGGAGGITGCGTAFRRRVRARIVATQISRVIRLYQFELDRSGASRRTGIARSFEPGWTQPTRCIQELRSTFPSDHSSVYPLLWENRCMDYRLPT